MGYIEKEPMEVADEGMFSTGLSRMQAAGGAYPLLFGPGLKGSTLHAGQCHVVSTLEAPSLGIGGSQGEGASKARRVKSSRCGAYDTSSCTRS